MRDYASLFSRSEVNRWLKNDLDSITLKINRYDASSIKSKTNYLHYLKHIYAVLEKFYPNEYVYKNEFLNKWLVQEIGSSECKSVVFNEFRIGKAIADLVMFNGTSRVFEIKTILDKEYRLSNQLLEYKKVFNEIYLIIPISKLDKYETFDHSVGIITYDSSIKDFSVARKPLLNPKIDASTIMEILYTKEYKQIVEAHYGNLPTMNDFDQYDICKKMIIKIPNAELNKLFIQAIKNRAKENFFVQRENIEFSQICLSLNLDTIKSNNLFNTLNSKIFS